MKRKPTELTIIVISDSNHEPPLSDFEAKIQPIEKAAFHLQAFFNFVKASAAYHEGEAFDLKPELGYFCGDLIALSEIGFAIAQSILKASSDLYDFRDSELRQDEIKSGEPENQKAAETVEDSEKGERK